MSRFAALRRWIARAFVGAALLFALSWWLERRLPEPSQALPELAQAPVQGATTRTPFEFEYKGKSCQVRPVASYELWGLVVSHNDIHSFSDIYHDATSVDTLDICVAWGRNVASGVYREAEFWSAPFVCYFRTPPGVDLDPAGVSNNHLITDDPAIRRTLEGVHLGDQVHLRGMLVDYRMEDWGDFWRRTSTVRTDSGCEVVFLERFDVLRANAPLWHVCAGVAKLLLVLLPIAWLVAVVVEARSGHSSLGEL